MRSKFPLLLTAIFASTTALAQTNAELEGDGGVVRPVQQETDIYVKPPTTPEPAPTPTVTATPKAAPKKSTINQGAQQGAASQNNGSMTNAIIGAALMAAGTAPCPTPQGCNVPLMMMGALALMQAGHDAGAAAASGRTATASDPESAGDPSSSGKDSSGKTPTDGKGKSSLSIDAKTQAGLDILSNQGYKVSEDGVTNPDGSFTPASAFDSAAGMTSAGFDPSAVKEAQSALAEITGSKISVASIPTSDGGGGGGGGGASASNTDYSKLFANNAAGIDSKKLMAGKTVLFDGEPIGVRGNNIFEMMHQAYQTRRKGNQFVESEFSEATVRQPASVRPRGK